MRRNYNSKVESRPQMDVPKYNKYQHFEEYNNQSRYHEQNMNHNESHSFYDESEKMSNDIKSSYDNGTVNELDLSSHNISSEQGIRRNSAWQGSNYNFIFIKSFNTEDRYDEKTYKNSKNSRVLYTFSLIMITCSKTFLV